MNDEQEYNDWLASKQNVQPSAELADQIMAAVAEQQVMQRATLLVRASVWLERSRFAPYMACSIALSVGAIPFLYLAYVAQFIAY